MLHPCIPDETLNLARHELLHSTMAHLLGYYVGGIEVGATRGCTTITYGTSPATFPSDYTKSPIRASLAVVQTLAIIRAGAYGELHGGRHGSPARGQDA